MNEQHNPVRIVRYWQTTIPRICSQWSEFAKTDKE